jgi:hypothetical protein
MIQNSESDDNTITFSVHRISWKTLERPWFRTRSFGLSEHVSDWMYGMRNGICCHNGAMSCLLLYCSLPSVGKGVTEQRFTGGIPGGFSKCKPLVCFITHCYHVPQRMLLQEIPTSCTIKIYLLIKDPKYFGVLSTSHLCYEGSSKDRRQDFRISWLTECARVDRHFWTHASTATCRSL